MHHLINTGQLQGQAPIAAVILSPGLFLETKQGYAVKHLVPQRPPYPRGKKACLFHAHAAAPPGSQVLHVHLHVNLPHAPHACIPQPPSWGDQLHNLQVLRLSRNRLSGPIPDSWANMTRLQVLSLGSNAVGVGGAP